MVVLNALGLHARPAALLVRAALQYDADVVMQSGGQSVNGKSIMGILTLGASQGAQVVVSAEGCDAADAIRAIEKLFACRFHEGGSVEEAIRAVLGRRSAGTGGPRPK